MCKIKLRTFDTPKQPPRCVRPYPKLYPAQPCLAVLAHLPAITWSPLEGSWTVTAARAAAASDVAAKIPVIQPRTILFLLRVLVPSCLRIVSTLHSQK